MPKAVAAKSLGGIISKVFQVFVVNWPDMFKTQEQNLDTSRNIKVHEQGTANVNVINTVPIPVQYSSPEQGWEYSTSCFSNWDAFSSGLPQRLNDKASEGWELVATLQFQPGLACEYWKRLI